MGRRRKSLKVWWLPLAGAFGLGGVLFLCIFAVAAAVLGASFTGCQKGPESAAANQAGPAPSAYALQSISPGRLAIYQHAGQRLDIDWTFLASIGTQECSGTCAGDNGSGCAGPMQIAFKRGSACSPGSEPTLWERFAVSAHPGHPPNINDPADAIYTAARILRQDKAAPPTGGSYAEYRRAACNYYGACSYANVAYADEVMARAVQYGFTGQGAPQATSPQLSQPVTASQGQCSASTIAPEAASASAIVKVAESQLGEGEQPPPSPPNCTKYGPCEEWCSLFASWVWMKAGVPIPGPTVLYGYSGSLYTWAAEHGGRVLPATARPSPGDAVFFGKGPAESVHVGLVTRVLRDGRIETIDGNNHENKVGRAGPFQPSSMTIAGEPIYGYAQPPAPNSKRA